MYPCTPFFQKIKDKQMEDHVLDALEGIGYCGNLLSELELKKAVEEGPKSKEFTKLVEWICKELKVFCNLEETVNAVESKEDSSTFLLEISSFLKELGCSYTLLVEGHLSDRLSSKESRLLLLDYLLTELMAARMIKVDKPNLGKGLELKLKEKEKDYFRSSTAADLKAFLIALKFPKPPDNLTPAMLFSKVEKKLGEVVSQAPPDLIGKPLFTGRLTEKQWHTLGETQEELQDEYRVRRDMLIKRLDVTIQSFQWSEKAKNNENAISSKFNSSRAKMEVQPKIDLADLLAAREDLAVIEKTSNASVRKNTQCSVNRVIIGRVPDRGGRPSEQEAPPPEMPSWQKDRASGGGGFGGGGGRGGRGRGDFSRGSRGGGRVQGGWNQGDQGEDNRGGGYQDNRGYRDNRGGGYQDNRGYRDNRGGGYQDNRGYRDNRGGGYQDNRGYQDDRGGGYQDNRGCQDNRGHYDNRGGYEDKDRGGHRGRRGYQQGGSGRDRRDSGRRDYR